MVWLQITLFSLLAGTILFFINKKEYAKFRKFYYLIFIIAFSVLITAAFGFQARIDTSDIIFSYLLPSTILSIVLCAEAIFISIVIHKYADIANVFFYLPVFLLMLWVVYFITGTIIVSFYPGS